MKRWICATIISAMVGLVQAATLNVPGNYGDIQSAINAANDGDEIVVSPGVYLVHDTILIPKKITLRSTFDGKNFEIIKNTVIKPDRVLIQLINLQSDDVTIRGFTLTRDTTPIPPNTYYAAGGIMSIGATGTIEYNIIENFVDIPYPQQGQGAAIAGISGLIQNNIIRNCYANGGGSAIAGGGGIVSNNVIYNNPGVSVSAAIISSSAKLVNNTLYNTGGVISVGAGEGSVVNNIIWEGSSTPSVYTGVAPRNCLIKGYAGPGTGNLDADPQFVDAANGDFHLKAISPCIDSGLITTGTQAVKADIEGVQRGIRSVQTPPGYAAKCDIGAYEYKPKPVAVWLPDGGPDSIASGNAVQVAWEMDTATAGTTISLQLYDDETFVQDFGFFFLNSGAGQSQINVDRFIPTSDTYYIRGVSALDPSMTGATPFMTIFGVTSIRPGRWSGYR